MDIKKDSKLWFGMGNKLNQVLWKVHASSKKNKKDEGIIVRSSFFIGRHQFNGRDVSHFKMKLVLGKIQYF